MESACHPRLEGGRRNGGGPRAPAFLLVALLAGGVALGGANAGEAGTGPPGTELPVRPSGQSWFEWFCQVVIPLDQAERLMLGFTRLSMNGRTFEFVPATIFDVDGLGWVLVLRGGRETVDRAANEVHLDPIGMRVRLRPASRTPVRTEKCPADVAFVVFEEPPRVDGKVLSGFPSWGDAGAAYDVLDENRVRERYRPIREIRDVILEIHERALRKESR